MANLISKVVRSSANGRNEGWHTSSKDKTGPNDYATSHTAPKGSKRGTIISRMGKTAPIREGSNGSEIQLAEYPEPHGITKTVETTIIVDSHGDGDSDKTYGQHDGAYDGHIRHMS